jgi:hypothetical protein
LCLGRQESRAQAGQIDCVTPNARPDPFRWLALRQDTEAVGDLAEPQQADERAGFALDADKFRYATWGDHLSEAEPDTEPPQSAGQALCRPGSNPILPLFLSLVLTSRRREWGNRRALCATQPGFLYALLHCHTRLSPEIPTDNGAALALGS